MWLKVLLTGRSLGQVVLRRNNRARPIPISPKCLPPTFLRTINIRAPGSQVPNPGEGEILEPLPYEIIPASASPEASSSNSATGPAAGSSQHPFAAVSEESDESIGESSGTSGDASTSTSGSNSEEEESPLEMGITPTSTLLSPPPPVPIPPRVQHPFDTHAFVSYLEKSGIPSDRARTYMESVRQMIVKRQEQATREMLGKEDMENAAYLFKAALSELRTELSVRARNDGTALRTMSGAIQREVDSLEQKMKEDVQTLKHDIEMDMNNRKEETRTDMKGFEIDIEKEINNKFTISLGDLRTELESAKWDATRRAISIIVLIVVAGVAVSLYTAPVPPAQPASTIKKATPMRDMSVGTDDDLIEDDLSISDEKLEKILQERVGRLQDLQKQQKSKVGVEKGNGGQRI